MDTFIALCYVFSIKTVRYTVGAARDLKRHGTMAVRVRTAISEYAEGNGAHANNVTRLVGTTGSRMRVGDYRAVFEETETAITVTKIAPRGGAYD